MLVWGAISRKGPSPLAIFKGTMDSIYYQKEIIGKALLPFIHEHFQTGHRFMQDNDPKHVSKSTLDYFKENDVNWWPTPPESPDLNPIERVWAELKDFVSKYGDNKTEAGLVRSIKQFWEGMSVAKCNNYINKMYEVIPEVVKRNGRATKY